MINECIIVTYSFLSGFGGSIDLIHKWRPIYYSFIFMLISLPKGPTIRLLRGGGGGVGDLVWS